jgi:hypothetical protein
LSLSRRFSALFVLSILALFAMAGCGGAPAENAVPEGSHLVSPAVEASTAEVAHDESASSQATPSIPAPTPATTSGEPSKGTLVDGWVTGIPDAVPKFSFGTIDRKQSSIIEGAFGTVFHLCYTGVHREDIDAYAQTLMQKGFAVAKGEIGDTYTLTASLKLDWGKVTLIVTLTDASGMATYALDAPV